MDIAQLQFEIDSRKAQQAKKDLEGLTAAAEKTEAAAESLSQADKEGEDRYKAIARAAIERQQSLANEVRTQMQSNSATRQATAPWHDQARAYTQARRLAAQLSDVGRADLLDTLMAETSTTSRSSAYALRRSCGLVHGMLSKGS